MTLSNLSSRLTLALALACAASVGAAYPIAPPPQRPDSNAAAVLRGRVGIAVSGSLAAVRRAHVTLTGGTAASPRVADTDAEGRFHFDGLVAGAYRITVAKAGFVMSTAASGVSADARIDVHVGTGEATTPTS